MIAKRWTVEYRLLSPVERWTGEWVPGGQAFWTEKGAKRWADTFEHIAWQDFREVWQTRVVRHD